MPKYYLYWTEVQHNQYATNDPIEADNPDEAWDLFWDKIGLDGFMYDIIDSDTTDSYGHEAQEVDE